MNYFPSKVYTKHSVNIFESVESIVEDLKLNDKLDTSHIEFNLLERYLKEKTKLGEQYIWCLKKDANFLVPMPNSVMAGGSQRCLSFDIISQINLMHQRYKTVSCDENVFFNWIILDAPNQGRIHDVSSEVARRLMNFQDKMSQEVWRLGFYDKKAGYKKGRSLKSLEDKKNELLWVVDNYSEGYDCSKKEWYRDTMTFWEAWKLKDLG